MRKLWESDEPFKFEGKYFSSDFYYLYTKSKTRIPSNAKGLPLAESLWADKSPAMPLPTTRKSDRWFIKG